MDMNGLSTRTLTLAAVVATLASAGCSERRESDNIAGAGSGGLGGGTAGGGGIGGGGGGETGGSGGTGGSGTGGAGGLQPTICGDAVPEARSSCDTEGQHCTWGDDPRFYCRTSAICNSSGGSGLTWMISMPKCADPFPDECPASKPEAGGACDDDDGLDCHYDGGTYCYCTDCPPSGSPCEPGPVIWYCDEPPGGDCPDIVPNAGTECSVSADTSCQYFTCGYAATCKDGVWTVEERPCA
jgi:hypothetical protein